MTFGDDEKMEYQLNVDWADFLRNYWQKRPVLLKQAFKNFVDPISPDELAGLAMENEIDSRLVSQQQGAWQLDHGPFTRFDHLPAQDWSLLVQAVNHWHEPSAALMRPFRQLPDWRIDDLMVSFSVPGGGVGPHVDQYDVFIIQGSGRRRWRVGEKQPLEQHTPHPDLLQVAPFAAIVDQETTAGDLLYIPPGFPHEGYAIENALNYSVGFRAPNSRELINSFADYLLINELGNERYSDPGLVLREHPAEIQPAELQALRNMMLAQLDHAADFQRWLGEFITQSRHELDIAPADPPYQPTEIGDLLEQGEKLRRISGLRVLRIGQSCYVNGEVMATTHLAAADALARYLVVDADKLGHALEDAEFLALLCQWVNQGYWYFID